VRGGEGVEEGHGSPDLGREQVPVAAVDQGATVRVADSIGDKLRLHPGASHQRDGRVPEPVESEVGDDDRLAALAELLVRKAAPTSAGVQTERNPLSE
jgi:hypothetical protein